MNNTTIKMALAVVSVVSIALLWNWAGIVDGWWQQGSRVSFFIFTVVLTGINSWLVN